MSKLYSEWDDYRDQVIPREAPDDQVGDVRAAFVAGWFAALAQVRTAEDAVVVLLYRDAIAAMNREQTAMEERADGRAKP